VYRYFYQTKKIICSFDSSSSLDLQGLSEPAVVSERESQYTVIDVLTYVIFRMTKLTQKHPCYITSLIKPDEEAKKSSSNSFHLISYCDDDNLRIFEILQDVINLSISLDINRPDINTNMLKLCLKVLKINLWNVAKDLPKIESRKGYKADLMDKTSSFLIEVIKNQTIDLSIIKEAIDAFVLGFLIFKRKSTERITFLLQILEESSSNDRYQLLCHTLLLQLANWDKISTILGADTIEIEPIAVTPKKSIKKLSEKVSESKHKKKTSITSTLLANPIVVLPKVEPVAKPVKVETKAPAAKKVLPTNEHAFKLLESLVLYVVEEAKQFLNSQGEPHLTPATHFLLVLQKKVSDLVYGPEFLVKYLELIFSHSKQLLLLLNEKNNNNGSTKVSMDLLKCTIVECVIQKLLKKLSHHSTSVEDSPLIIKLLKSMVPLTEVFDMVNSQSHTLLPLKFSAHPPAKKRRNSRINTSFAERFTFPNKNDKSIQYKVCCNLF